MNLAPATLRKWSAEALNLALPPLRFATSWGLRIADLTVPKPVAPARKRAPRKQAPAHKAPVPKRVKRIQ